MKKEVNIGLIGCGTIGAGVAKQLKNTSEIEKRTGVKLKIKSIADKNSKNITGLGFSPKVVSTVDQIFNDSEIDIVIELIGGYHPAYDFIKKALMCGKNVVTANKAVIDKWGSELSRIAEKNKVHLLFGASVGGGIPILGSIKGELAGNSTKAIYGILNGTCNYIITRMCEGMSYEEALSQAQQKGFAEADPSFDVEGNDTAQKLAIVSSVAFGSDIKSPKIKTDGITRITGEDIEFALSLGYTIKLLAIAKLGNELELRVHPTMIPLDSPLASIINEVNAIHISGNAHVTLSGEGAGQVPTAGAVVSDVVAIARKAGSDYVADSFFGSSKYKIKNADDIKSKFYIRMSALNKPGTLAEISRIMGQEKINISKVIQMGDDAGKYVPVVAIIDEASGKSVASFVKKIKKSKRAKVDNIIRIEELS